MLVIPQLLLVGYLNTTIWVLLAHYSLSFIYPFKSLDSIILHLHCGGSGVYISPIHFILNPCLWLALTTKYKGTHLQGPNFAYALLLRRLPQYAQASSLDLSSVQHIFNAAEPIAVDVAKQFIETFSKYGLSRNAMTGGFGLAESCVYVCDDGHGVLRVKRDVFETDNVAKPIDYYDCITESKDDDRVNNRNNKNRRNNRELPIIL